MYYVLKYYNILCIIILEVILIKIISINFPSESVNHCSHYVTQPIFDESVLDV